MTSLSLDPFGSDAGLDLEVEMDVTNTLNDVEITLGPEVGAFLVAENAVGDLTLGFEWIFTATVAADTTGTLDADATFSVDFMSAPSTDLSVEAQIDETDISFRARAGALGLDIEPDPNNTSTKSKVLLEGATGAPLGTEVFRHHLRDRYLPGS